MDESSGDEELALYVPDPFSTSAIRRLGSRLRSNDPLSEADEALRQRFLQDAEQRQSYIGALIRHSVPRLEKAVGRQLQLSITGRTKTMGTLNEKLVRQPTFPLSSIQDVAGVRVVGDFDINEQSALAKEIERIVSEVLPSSKRPEAQDRRSDPHAGYRALHLIVFPGDRPVEIQLRTLPQHEWAEAYEALGDVWGREIRYGEPVRPGPDGSVELRQGVVEQMQRLGAEIIPVHEQTLIVVNRLRSKNPPDGSPSPARDSVLSAIETAEVALKKADELMHLAIQSVLVLAAKDQ